MLAGYFGVWGLFWNVADIPSVSSLKKNDFPPLNSKQKLIASWLGSGPHAYSSPVFLDFLFSVLSLLYSYAMYHSPLFICESAQLCLENCVCLKSPTISGSCNFSFSSPYISELWGEGYDLDVSFRLEHSEVPHSLHTDQLWISVLTVSHHVLSVIYSTRIRFPPVRQDASSIKE